jgi:thiamine-phosphate pyrophosphorylase
MAHRPLLYYITDRTQFPGSEPQQWQKLLAKIQQAAACEVDFIQLREKDLSGRELEDRASQVLRVIREASLKGKTRLLINSRVDVALAVRADGVHLRSDDISAKDARITLQSDKASAKWWVGVSCHSEEQVRTAAADAADVVVFGPVFEKSNGFPTSIATLQRACQWGVPVFALGGVTVGNARACVEAGAIGIAGIRLFQNNDIADTIGQIIA